MANELIIVGSGPAGLTAAIYAGRAGLNPLVIEGFMSGGMPGGALMMTSEVENFPGFPNGIMGPELMAKIRQQAARFGAEFVSEDVVEAQLLKKPFVVKTQSKTFETHALIIATGASPQILEIPSVKQFWGKGVSACATCDGALPMYRNQVVAVVGGGDTAMEEALFLTRFASKVIIIHRRNELRAVKAMQERVKANPKIEIIFDSTIEEVLGDSAMKALRIKNLKTGAVSEIEAKGLFMAIGRRPNTGFLDGQLKIDGAGYIIVAHPSTATSIGGVFACGDVVDPHYRQAVVAAASGCIAALDAERYLSSMNLG